MYMQLHSSIVYLSKGNTEGLHCVLKMYMYHNIFSDAVAKLLHVLA